MKSVKHLLKEAREAINTNKYDEAEKLAKVMIKII